MRKKTAKEISVAGFKAAYKIRPQQSHDTPSWDELGRWADMAKAYAAGYRAGRKESQP